MPDNLRNKWHGDAPDPVRARPKSARGRNLFWLTALGLAIVGTIAAIVLYPDRMVQPRFLTMTVREYASPLLPVNAWTVQDGKLLAKHFAQPEDFYDKQNREQFSKFLTRLESWNEGPLVVHLGALARVQNGSVVLFLGDTDPDQPSGGEPLKKVLDAMRGKSEKPGDRLLILDLARPVADARLGILTDTIADAVDRDLTEVELPFFVLASCGKGQMSHTSDELGQSVFAYHIDLALRGFAERTNNQRVSVTELADFVRKRTDRWVWVNRGQRQEPTLYGKAKDFHLAQLGSGAPEPPGAPEDKTYPVWLTAAWKERDGYEADGSFRRAPWAFRRLETLIHRAEKRWRGGADDADGRLSQDLSQKLAGLRDAIKKASPPPPARVFSLAEIKNPKTDAVVKEFQLKLDRYLARVPEPGAKVDDGDKGRLEELKKARGEILDDFKKLPYDTSAAVIAASAVRPPNLTAGRIRGLVEILGEVRANTPSARRFAELVYLERLKDLIDRIIENAEWNGAAAHAALDVAMKAEERLAELGKMPAGLDPWSLASMTKAEELRAKGDKTLFASVDFSGKDARALFTQAEQTYRPIPKRLEILGDLREQRDIAFVELPGWASGLITPARPEPFEEHWFKGIDAARTLADLLESKDLGTLDSEPPSLIEWQSVHQQMRKAENARIGRLTQLGLEGKAADMLEWQALLENPRFPAERRATIWSGGRALALKLHGSMPSPESSDADAAAAGIVPGDDLVARREGDRAKRRVRQAYALLELAAYPRLEDLKDKEEGIVPAKIHLALSNGVPSAFQFYARPKEKLAPALAKADRLSRVFPGDVLKRTTGADFHAAFLTPAESLERMNRESYVLFLRERYQREARDLKAQKSPHEYFYAEAADAFASPP